MNARLQAVLDSIPRQQHSVNINELPNISVLVRSLKVHYSVLEEFVLSSIAESKNVDYEIVENEFQEELAKQLEDEFWEFLSGENPDG